MESKIQNIFDALNELKILELKTLIDALKEGWGVSGEAAMVMGGAAVAVTADAAEEKDAWDVVLESIDDTKKMGVIKVLRALTGLGLKEAKDMAESKNIKVKEGVSKEEGEKIKKELTEAGAVIKMI